MRAASSLDSATHPLLSSSLTTARSTTGLGGRISPYTGLTDVTNLIHTSLGRTTPPLATTLRSGKNTSGSLLDQLRSSSRGTLPLSPSRSGSPRLTPSGFYKNMKQQLKDELKSAVEERRMLLEMNEREIADLCPQSSDRDLRALFDLYSDVPDVLLPSAALSRNLRMRNMDPYDSPLPAQELPPGYYKSHEFQGIDPMGFGSSEYRRPVSSMTGTDSIRVAGLSSLGNHEELFTDPYRKFSTNHILLFYSSSLNIELFTCFVSYNKHTLFLEQSFPEMLFNVSTPVTTNLFFSSFEHRIQEQVPSSK